MTPISVRQEDLPPSYEAVIGLPPLPSSDIPPSATEEREVTPTCITQNNQTDTQPPVTPNQNNKPAEKPNVGFCVLLILIVSFIVVAASLNNTDDDGSSVTNSINQTNLTRAVNLLHELKGN